MTAPKTADAPKQPRKTGYVRWKALLPLTVTLLVIGVLFVPAYFLFRYLVARYRKDIYARLETTHAFRVIKTSKLWSVYEMFRP